MVCPSCHQEIGDNICEFCDVKIDIAKFKNLAIRFHKNHTWLKNQSSISYKIQEQFINEIIDPLHAEQQSLIQQGMSSIEVIHLFEELK